MRARNPPGDDRPVGHDGQSRVPFAADVFSAEDLDAYFQALEAGAGNALAARAIGRTGTYMKRFLGRDPVFTERWQAARAEAQELHADRLQATSRTRAIDGGSDRMLEVELATWAPGYEHLRRDRVKVDAKMEHALLIEIDPAALDAMPMERLVALRELLAEAAGGIIDGTVRELPAGETGGDGDGA